MEDINVERHILLYDFVESEIAEYLDIKKYDNLNPYLFCQAKKYMQFGTEYLLDIFSYKIEVGLDELYYLTVYNLGFESIDPILKKNKKIGLTLSELQNVINDFVTMKNLEIRTNILSEVLLDDLDETEFLGCTVTNFLDEADYYDEIMVSIMESYQLYLKNNKSELFMIEANTTNGMCGSGWTTASFGNIKAYKIKEIPTSFEYTPTLNNNIFKVVSGIYDEYNNCNDNISLNIGEEGILFVSFNGEDYYYPNGVASFNKDSKSLVKNHLYIYNNEVFANPDFNLDEYNDKVNKRI